MASVATKYATAIVVVYLWALLNVSVFAASWDCFILAHTIDPEPNKGTSSWNKQVWQSWLVKRNDEFSKACPKGRPLGSKPVNSIVVATRAEIRNTFADKNSLVEYAGQYHWSKNLHRIYVFKTNSNKGKQTTNLYDCGRLYVLAKLDSQSKPFHFHGMSETKTTTGNINFNYGKCKKITK